MTYILYMHKHCVDERRTASDNTTTTITCDQRVGPTEIYKWAVFCEEGVNELKTIWKRIATMLEQKGIDL